MIAASTTDIVGHALEVNPQLALASLGCGTVVAIGFFKLLFDGWTDFWTCVRFWFTPDVISLFLGEYWDDVKSSLRLFLWLLLSVGTVVLAYHQLPDVLPHIFHKAV